MSAETPVLGAPVPSPEAPPAARACVVMLGGRPFAVDVADAREVVVLDATTPVPGAPPAVLGVMNLRGNVLPVVEARPLLGLPVHNRRDRALVVADGDQRAAVVIEGVLGLTALEDVQPQPAGEGDLRSWAGSSRARPGGHIARRPRPAGGDSAGVDIPGSGG